MTQQNNKWKNKDMRSAPPRLLYLAGISPRSGTNYVYRLLGDHPSCVDAAGGEDYFLLKSDMLYLFAESIYNKWKTDWDLRKNSQQTDLLRSLGNGLVQFLDNQSVDKDGESVIVTKTPHVDNISRFPDLFSEGFLLILVRDGRAVTESSLRTFDLSFDAAAKIWRKGARQVISFMQKHGRSSEWHQIVKYEDVVKKTQNELSILFGKMGLESEKYPYEKLGNVPVVGSSTYGREEDVTWEEKESDESFDPTSRYESWSEKQHERFDWIAGNELEELNYKSKVSSRDSFQGAFKHQLKDLKQVPRASLEAAKRYAKKAVYSYILR